MTELVRLISENKDLANVFAAIASALATVMSAGVAIFALWVARSTLRNQRQHNVLSLTPLAEVTVSDWEHKLRVTLRNNGAGPLVVKKLVVGDGSEVKVSLLEWMPDLPEGTYWSNFAGCVDGRSISPDKAIVLLELAGDHEDVAFGRCRDEVRNVLRMLTVNVEFTDVYGTWLAPYRKSLEWFGRMLGENEHRGVET